MFHRGHVRANIIINGRLLFEPGMTLADFGQGTVSDRKGGSFTFCEDSIGRAFIMWQTAGDLKAGTWTSVELNKNNGFRLVIGRECIEAEKGFIANG